PLIVCAPQYLSISLTQRTDHILVTEERRIADDKIGMWPFGFRTVRVEQGISVFNRLQRLKNRVLGHVKSMALHPLQLADPDRDAGKLGGVGADLNAFHDLGSDFGLSGLQAQLLGFEIRLMLQVLQRAERQVEEVAGATGRI